MACQTVFGGDVRVNDQLPDTPTVRIYDESGTHDVPLASASAAVLCAIRDSNPEPAAKRFRQISAA